MAARTMPVPLAAVSPGLGGEGHGALGTGWCEATADGRWTGATEATLRLPLPAGPGGPPGGGPGGAVLRLACAPFLGAGAASQRLGVMVQGLLVGRFVLEGPAVLELALPEVRAPWAPGPDTPGPDAPGPDAPGPGTPVLDVRLLLPDAMPAGPDGRRRGIRVHSVELLAPAAPAVPGGDTAPDGNAALLLGFEPLGADAALAMTQRRAGAEPAGLFRWAQAAAAPLAAALATRLEGVGDPGSLVLHERAGDRVATHRRWGFRRLVSPGPPGETAAAAAAREERVQRALRPRLLAALAEPGRVAVHHAADADDTALPALAAALASLGPGWLLWVGPGAGGPPRVVAPRVLRATMPPLPPAASAERWLALCRAARELVGDGAARLDAARR